jgi:hypothetical protein
MLRGEYPIFADSDKHILAHNDGAQSRKRVFSATIWKRIFGIAA